MPVKTEDDELKGAYPIAYWDDLRAPASTINPPGQASDPDREASTGLLLFSATTQELCFVALQTPHAWVENTNIVPHVHWTKTSSAAGDVVWQMRYRMANPGEAFGDWSSPVTSGTTVNGTPDNDTDWQHLITSFGELDMNGMEISCMILFEISRLGADAADTYGADVRLLEFDCHYKANQPGSVEQFRKFPLANVL